MLFSGRFLLRFPLISQPAANQSDYFSLFVAIMLNVATLNGYVRADEHVCIKPPKEGERAGHA